MNVLMLGWELPPSISGGLGTACDGLLRGFASQGNLRITFVLPQHGSNISAYPSTIKLIELPLSQNRNDPANVRACAYDSAMLDAAEDYADAVIAISDHIGPINIIHAHDWLTFRAALRIRCARDTKLVAHVHSTEYDRATNMRLNRSIMSIETEAFAHADKIVSVSRYTKDIIVSKYAQDPGRVCAIHNASLLTDGAYGSFPLPDVVQTVTFLGRMTYQKGPELFLEVAHRVWTAAPQTRFVMAGRGELLELIKSLANALGMSQVISFPGFLDADGVRDLLGRSSVMVMPSISEPFGLAALEAICSGVPVVMSNQCGLAECVKAVITTDPLDVDSTANACLQILHDPVFARRLSIAARMEVAPLTWKHTADKFMDIYRELLQYPPVAASCL